MEKNDKEVDLYSPTALANRLDFSGDIDLNSIRDSIAQIVPRRWSEFILSVERQRFTNRRSVDVESWIVNRSKGRAFYHYIFVCYYTRGVTPSAKGFGRFFDDPNFEKDYYRMWNDWLDNEWIDEDGKISDELVKQNAKISFELMELPEMQKFLPTGVTYIQSRRNRKMDKEFPLSDQL